MRILILGLTVVLLAGCSKYSKILKSNDTEYKYAKAIEFYEADQCFKALPILEELFGVVRGTQRAEDVYYYFAKTHYCIGDYYLANYYFKNFTKTYKNSPRCEECLFMAANCSLQLSPPSSLDQTETRTAINEFQLFMDRYPSSPRKDTCNMIIADLREKLQIKAFEVAKLYHKTEKYKAARIALENVLVDFPGTSYTEEIMFLIVESNFMYAEKSVDSKKLERYEETTKSYSNFVARFPESKWTRKAENYFDRSLAYIDKLKDLNTDGI